MKAREALVDNGRGPRGTTHARRADSHHVPQSVLPARSRRPDEFTGKERPLQGLRRNDPGPGQAVGAISKGRRGSDARRGKHPAFSGQSRLVPRIDRDIQFNSAGRKACVLAACLIRHGDERRPAPLALTLEHYSQLELSRKCSQ